MVGVSIERKKIKQWIRETGLECCCFKESGDWCTCMNNQGLLPSDFSIKYTSPYYDSGLESRLWFLTLKDFSGYISDLCDLDIQDNVKELAHRLGGKGEIKVMAVPDIW